MLERSILPRFWRLRGSDLRHPDNLDLPGDLDPGRQDTSGATRGPCTVLLGPPGSGKTTALRTLEQATPEGVRVISFGSTGSEARLRDLVLRAVEALSTVASPGIEKPLLALDSLDEASLTTTQLSSFIDEIATDLPEGLRLVLACRTAAWLPGVHSALERRFGERLAVFDLSQLRRLDVATYADSAGTDGAAFLHAVEEAKALPLALNPNTLRFLLDTYLAGPGSVLPASQASLFESSLRRLLQEPNEQRRSPWHTQHASPLVNCAGRLAVLGLFTGRTTYRLLGEAGVDELSVDDLHSWEGDPPENWTSCIKSVLQSALFDAAGDMAVRFSHQTLAEYLAARHLASLDLGIEQINGLLRGRGGLLAPQVQAVAAWLVQLRPDRFSALLAEDPAAFALSGVEINEDSYREVLIHGLLGLARHNQLFDVPAASLRGLSYPGLSGDLRRALLDGSATSESRYLAVRIARENAVRDLSGTLTQLSMDAGEPTPIRNAAGHAVLEFGPDADIATIATLGQGEGPANDPDDELFGLGIKARVRLGESVPALLVSLRVQSNVDLFGNYRSILVIDLPAAILSPDLPLLDLVATLDWATATETHGDASEARAQEFDADRLFDSILEAGLRRLAEPGVTTAVAHLISQRMRTHRSLMRRRGDVSALPELKPQDRRALLDALHDELDSVRGIFGLARSGLLVPEDFGWIVARSATVLGSAQQARWVPWIRTMFDRQDSTHAQALSELLGRRPEYGESLASLLEPLEDPPNPWEDLDEDDSGETPTDDDIRSDLLECLDSAEADAFLRLCHFLRFTGGQRYAADDMPLDIRKLPGWTLLSTGEQGRVFELAGRFLSEGGVDLDRYLGSDTVGWDVITGIRAFVLFMNGGVAIELTDSRWGFWAPAFIVWGFGGEADSATSAALAELARRAPTQLVAATEEYIVARKNETATLERILSVLDTPSLPWMLHLLDDGVGGVRATTVAFERITELDQTTALQRLTLLLPEPNSASGLSELVASAMIKIGASAWDLAFPTLLSNSDLAKGTITSLSGKATTPPLSEDQIAQLWELSVREFPRNEDPEMRGVHVVGEREQIAIWRDRLIPILAGLGTVAAVEALQTLARRHSETWLWYHVQQAKAASRKGDWAPLGLLELTQVLDGQRQVLRNDADLLEVVAKAIEGIQGVLTSATPEATLLWSHRTKCDSTPGTGCVPKTEDEISDYIRNRLAPAVPRSVVNREVQVVRLNTKGIGQRTDILVEVPSAGVADRVLRVVVEVKGCWNEEVPTALQSQLVDTYLRRWRDAAGLFLIAWFDPGHGAKKGTWLTDPLRNSSTALRGLLDGQADAATSDGGHVVSALILDCSMPT